MSEGTTVRTKRMGARFFKNPPQPFMCIRDTLMGSINPCYVNVLSWEKVGCAGVSSDDVPLYGGMKVYPPRTEKKDVPVFAVMAHPDVLKQHGKNTRNPKERTWLIDVLLDFVEEMNSGVVFSRRYRVLRDRDITGELKEIWMAVQADRAKQCDQPQHQQQQLFDEERGTPLPPYSPSQHINEGQRDANVEQRTKFRYGPQNRTKEVNHPMAIRYSSHTSQNDNYVPSGLPNSQMQQLIHDEGTPQPPRYPSSAYHDEYDRQDASIERRGRGRYGNPQNRPKDGHYPMGGNKYRVIPSSNDHYIFRDPVLASNAQVQQANCLPYQAYQYQTLPRPMGQPFTPSVHSSPAINCPSPRTAPMSPVTLVRPGATINRYNGCTSVKEFLETISRESSNHQTQLPQSTGNVQAMHSSTGNYHESNQVSSLPNVIVLRHEETENRQIVPGQSRMKLSPPSQPQYPHLANSSPRPSKATASPRESNPKKSSTISFLKMLADRSAENNSVQSQMRLSPPSQPQYPHLANSSPRASKATASPRESNPKISSTISFLKMIADESAENNRNTDRLATEAAIEENTLRIDKLKMEDTTRIKVLRRDESLTNDKPVSRETSKRPTNGENPVQIERHQEDPINSIGSEDRLMDTSGEQNGNENDGLDTSVPKITKSMADSIKTVKQLSTGGNDESAKKTSNGQIVGSQQRVAESNEETTRTYTILRKPDVTASQKRVTSDMLQLSINESVHTDTFTSKSGDKRGGRLRRRR